MKLHSDFVFRQCTSSSCIRKLHFLLPQYRETDSINDVSDPQNALFSHKIIQSGDAAEHLDIYYEIRISKYLTLYIS